MADKSIPDRSPVPPSLRNRWKRAVHGVGGEVVEAPLKTPAVPFHPRSHLPRQRAPPGAEAGRTAESESSRPAARLCHAGLQNGAGIRTVAGMPEHTGVQEIGTTERSCQEHKITAFQPENGDFVVVGPDLSQRPTGDGPRPVRPSAPRQFSPFRVQFWGSKKKGGGGAVK